MTITLTVTVDPGAALLSTLTGSVEIHATANEPESVNNAAPLELFVGTRLFAPGIYK